MVALLDMELEQMDVKTAFLHGNLDEQILMMQLEGFKYKGKVDYVCLLHKSLHGLKQSHRQWYGRFDELMMNNGYHKSKYDNCVYFGGSDQGRALYLFFLFMWMMFRVRNCIFIKEKIVILHFKSY